MFDTKSQILVFKTTRLFNNLKVEAARKNHAVVAFWRYNSFKRIAIDLERSFRKKTLYWYARELKCADSSTNHKKNCRTWVATHSVLIINTTWDKIRIPGCSIETRSCETTIRQLVMTETRLNYETCRWIYRQPKCKESESFQKRERFQLPFLGSPSPYQYPRSSSHSYDDSLSLVTLNV